jgi:hypothetical protein
LIRPTDLNAISTDLVFAWGSNGCASALSFDFEEIPEHETPPRSGKNKTQYRMIKRGTK